MFFNSEQVFFCSWEKKKTKTHLTVAHSQRPPIGSNKNVVFNLSSIQKTAFFTMIFLFPWTSAEA